MVRSQESEGRKVKSWQITCDPPLKIFKGIKGVAHDKVLRGAKIALNSKKSALLSESKRSGKRRK